MFLSSSQHRSLSLLWAANSGSHCWGYLPHYSVLLFVILARRLVLESKLNSYNLGCFGQDPALIQPTPPPPINSYSKSSQSSQRSQYEKRSCREQRKLQSASEREQKAITCLLKPGTTIDCRVWWWCLNVIYGWPCQPG
jgi:hypothetical protein